MGVHARAIEVGERECGGKRRGKRASVAGLDEGKCVGVVDHTQGIGHAVSNGRVHWTRCMFWPVPRRDDGGRQPWRHPHGWVTMYTRVSTE